jgi:Putative zinc-finger
MKPCSRKRKLLAWLAQGELDAPRAQALRAHLEHCPGCRRYLEEISAVGERLATQPAEPEVEPSASFHRNLLARLRAEERVSPWAILSTRLNWRLAVSALGAAALLLLLLSLLPPSITLTPPVRITRLVPPPPMPARDLSASVANYERVASRSLDELDDLLTQQARRNPPSAPTFTAATEQVPVLTADTVEAPEKGPGIWGR